MAKKTSFQEYWLSEPQFKYIGPLENNRHYAKCSLCSKTIYLCNMGRGALISRKIAGSISQKSKPEIILLKINVSQIHYM